MNYILLIIVLIFFRTTKADPNSKELYPSYFEWQKLYRLGQNRQRQNVGFCSADRAEAERRTAVDLRPRSHAHARTRLPSKHSLRLHFTQYLGMLKTQTTFATFKLNSF